MGYRERWKWVVWVQHRCRYRLRPIRYFFGGGSSLPFSLLSFSLVCKDSAYFMILPKYRIHPMETIQIGRNIQKRTRCSRNFSFLGGILARYVGTRFAPIKLYEFSVFFFFKDNWCARFHCARLEFAYERSEKRSLPWKFDNIFHADYETIVFQQLFVLWSWYL